MAAYAELQVTSNFSFLRGASHPEELVARAAELGQAAMAVTDRGSCAGLVRAHQAARDAGIRLVPGARLDPSDGPPLLVLPGDRAAHGRLSRLISTGRRRGRGTDCALTLADLDALGRNQRVLVVAPDRPDAAFAAALAALGHRLGRDVFLAASFRYDGRDGPRLAELADLARDRHTPLVATNDVHAHTPERRPLQDVLTCIRHGVTLDQAGARLAANGERHLKAPAEMARLFRAWPEAVARTVLIAESCHFSLDELRHDYPMDAIAGSEPPDIVLARLTWAGAARRWPDGVPDRVTTQIRHELDLIARLNYAPYFLTVHDIVAFARGRGILCQGRGSAANSAVCYALGITAVDPSRLDLLFERFVSAERNEPPDIDVDFEHERREEVIQYIYERYGRERAGLAATVIRYRTRSAVRDVGKVFGLSLDALGALAGQVWGRGGDLDAGAIRDAGLDPGDATLALALDCARVLRGFPRHLSQHVGGFVITRDRLDTLVPIANAAMDGRTVIEWDKDDLDALGILKIDILALGMLSCIRRAFDLIAGHHGRRYSLATVPAEDPGVYDMLCRADSLGVFQVESRAQMSMLPRLQPRSFYDLVIEVAIVRPGPIQGDMVHPYLRRRAGAERVTYPSPELEAVLGKTLGVPLFQEQAMRIAIVAAGFTPGEADRLRKAMATFRHHGGIHAFETKLVAGMVARGYERDFAERCFRQIEGFGDYGFPESHAASFALLVYVSAWLKRRWPAAFACALLNSQPMGFYAPAQIVRDARDHGVPVRPVDVNASAWDCTLEATDDGATALRLGFRQVKGLNRADMDRLIAARGAGYDGPADLQRRAGLGRGVLDRLAQADAFTSLGLSRRQALWAVRGLDDAPPLPLFAGLDTPPAPPAPVPETTAGEAVVADYRSLRLSLRDHPLALLRPALAGTTPAADLTDARPGRRLTVAGLVLVRQRPGSARNVVFVTLEDETGPANVIIWPQIADRFRKVLLTARLLAVRGRLQKEGRVIHVIAETLIDRSDLLDRLGAAPVPVPSRDFR